MNYSEKLLLSLVKNSKNEGVFPVITAMLTSGVSANIRDPELGGISLLMFAISIGNFELTELLIKFNADINCENNVLSRCILCDFSEGFDLILAAPGLAKESIEFAFFSSLLDKKRIKYTEKLLQNYKEICGNARATDGRSPMEFTSRIKNMEALQLLEKFFVTYLD